MTVPHLVLLAAGESSRFTGKTPKHMLIHPSGFTMGLESIVGITGWSSITIALRNKLYYDHVMEEMKRCFKDRKVNVVVVGQTKSQVDTARRVVLTEKLDIHPVVFKDCDSHFKCDINSFLGDKIGIINPVRYPGYLRINNKSMSEGGFNCGIYGFRLGSTVVASESSSLHSSYQSYPSSVEVSPDTYLDWGTQYDWDLFCRESSTLFFDVDAFFDEYEYPDLQLISIVSGIYDKGKTYLILTSSKPDYMKEELESKLFDADILYDRLITGLPNTRRVMISHSDRLDYAQSLTMNKKHKNLHQLKALITGKI